MLASCLPMASTQWNCCCPTEMEQFLTYVQAQEVVEAPDWWSNNPQITTKFSMTFLHLWLCSCWEKKCSKEYRKAITISRHNFKSHYCCEQQKGLTSTPLTSTPFRLLHSHQAQKPTKTTESSNRAHWVREITQLVTENTFRESRSQQTGVAS